MTLEQFFTAHPRCALGFSGGVDSSYLLAAGREYGAEVRPYYVRTVFQPRFELEDARRLCRELGAELTVLDYDILSVPCVADNPPDRCYYCKRAIFTLIRSHAAAEGCTTLIDGNNASDDASDRPGMRAVSELGVLSPLRLCGITKAEVRRRSEELGLFTASKPAYACLATRVPTGTKITLETLKNVEQAEEILSEMGFADFRVRICQEGARIQVREEEMADLLDQRAVVMERLKPLFPAVLLDLEARKPSR